MPLLDFSREFIPNKTILLDNIRAVNNDETSNNMLEYIESFKIPHEKQI
jgi:hypothetical protein